MLARERIPFRVGKFGSGHVSECGRDAATPMLRVTDLRVSFSVGSGFFTQRAPASVRAVDGISFEIGDGETFSIVGESGCGKTTTARAILGIVNRTAGAIEWDGRDIASFDAHERRNYRSEVQAVFQDPFSSMNPRLRVREFITEPLLLNSTMAVRERRERAREAMTSVGLRADDANNFPHEFSGGQRQRIAIARALASSPRLIVLDEPVSSLDVSIRAQIMNLLKDLRDREGFAYLFIAHHLGTVRYMGGKVGVMYLGKIMEFASADDLFNRPQHPYTRALFSAALPDRPDDEREAALPDDELASATNIPSGCRFRTRCPKAQSVCMKSEPEMKHVRPGHWAACHFI
jgi:oligopeptide transport system ATP-binding protein